MFSHRILELILLMPRAVKRLVVITLDASLCVLAVWIAFYLRLGEFVPIVGQGQWRPVPAIMISMALALPIFIVHGFYRAILRYAGWRALMTVIGATIIYGVLYASVFTVWGVDGVPRTIGLIQPLLLLLLVGASRVLARFWFDWLHERHLKQTPVQRVLIYGAGSAGRQLVAAMANSQEMRVVGFLDDAPHLRGQVLNGYQIFSPDDLAELVKTRNITMVFLALPSISRKRRNEILALIRDAKVSVRTLPSLTELAQGKVSLSSVRDLDIDDLLGRDPVVPDESLLSRNIKGKVVMVTGAGGSIGSELSRQIVSLGPAILLLVEQSEFALYEIHAELLRAMSGGAVQLIPLLGSVRDAERMRRIMTTWPVDTIYHAAAYKHVPLVEHNPAEGVLNNVIGTCVVAVLAVELGVNDFVLISTDKAVRPTNIMGASKRLAEMVLQAMAQDTQRTRFSMVRFGNVLGSSGSVVPRFRQQIRDGGPITLTHPDITRYFMTIPEAAQLVIQAGAMAKGGDVFVLDMGQPVRIMDLARRMVELTGLTVKDEANPNGVIEIEITGLRPGEKLFEELLIGDDPMPTSHPRIMTAHESFLPWAILEKRIQTLGLALQENDIGLVRLILEQLVFGYNPSGEIVDWIHIGQSAKDDALLIRGEISSLEILPDK
ncbi:MAG: polysaccharide biosynthesis protein [Curvibacter sp. PD_MW3]|nr:MAG: polysaccharide biosynthesis protein [Curvibacter sp. PD_MW3]